MENNSLTIGANTVISFTEDQSRAINGIFDFISAPYSLKNAIASLSGAGGTGKTFITKHIIQNCIYSPSSIVCAAPTHKACRVLSNSLGGKKVMTIQSMFGFRMDISIADFDPNNPKFTPVVTPKLEEGVSLLIIDEASMINAELVKYINNFCKKRDIKILYIGDASQLSPVNERQSTAFVISNNKFVLNQIVRQQETNPVKTLLDIIRQDIANKTYNFLDYIKKNSICYNELGEGFCVVNPTKFRDLIQERFNNEEYKKNINLYRVIGYTNLKVTAWNKFIRDVIVENPNNNVITKHDLVMSYETIVDNYLAQIITNSEDYIVKDIVNMQDKNYGFKGHVVRFQNINGGAVSPPVFIIDHKDKSTAIKYATVINKLKTAAQNAHKGARSTAWKVYFNFKKQYLTITNFVDKNGKIIIKRDLDYGFAITSHRSQGSTYNNVFVDLNDILFDKNGVPYNDIDDLLRRVYVACSRAKNELIICYGA